MQNSVCLQRKASLRQRYGLVVLALCAVLVGVMIGLWRTPLTIGLKGTYQALQVEFKTKLKSGSSNRNGVNSIGGAGNSQGPGYANGSFGPAGCDGRTVAESDSSGSEVPAFADSPEEPSLSLPEVLIMIPAVQNPGAGETETSPSVTGTVKHPIRLVSYKVQKGDTLANNRQVQHHCKLNCSHQRACCS